MDKERDWKSFCALMRATAEISATQPKSDIALGLMFSVLARYDLTTVQKAVQTHLSSANGRYFPTPSDLIGIIDGKPEERAEVAWRLFLKAVSKWGGMESVRFPAAAYHYAITSLGGWIKVNKDISGLTEKEVDYRGREWRTLYQIGERSSSWKTVPAYLAGEFEYQNRLNGYLDYLPKVIDVESGSKLEASQLVNGRSDHGCAGGLASRP